MFTGYYQIPADGNFSATDFISANINGFGDTIVSPEHQSIVNVPRVKHISDLPLSIVNYAKHIVLQNQERIVNIIEHGFVINLGGLYKFFGKIKNKKLVLSILVGTLFDEIFKALRSYLQHNKIETKDLLPPRLLKYFKRANPSRYQKIKDELRKIHIPPGTEDWKKYVDSLIASEVIFACLDNSVDSENCSWCPDDIHNAIKVTRSWWEYDPKFWFDMISLKRY